MENPEESESLHWADQIAKEVRDRVERELVLAGIVKEKGYIVYDEKTPSGKIHIGSGRGWVIHDTIARALRDLGLKGRFILSSDDIDPFDKMNADLPKGYEKYLGLPFRNIPSPVKGYKSFAEYYFNTCVEKFEEFGINAEIESTGERYIKGDFNRTIKIALDNADKINDIYLRYYGKSPEKLPFNPICKKCGKIGTTQAYEWDSEREIVRYKCSETLVKWAKGCGYDGETSPYNGNGKLPWKVEWAAKWPTVGVVCELAGKDHFTVGGSRTIAVAISNEIFDFSPPYPSTRTGIGDGYEFFTISGRKMSTSKGEGIGFVDATDFAPGHILRYLLVATRPRAVIDFDPVNRNDLILLYERYDKTERIYFGAEKEENPHDAQKHRRVYELSHIGKIPSKMLPQISFTHAALVLQASNLDEQKAINLLQEHNKIPKKLDKEDLNYLHDRFIFARKWLESFAPEQYKFQLQDKVHIKLTENEKEMFKELNKILQHGSFTEEELHSEFYNLCQEFDYDSKEFFKKAYLILINKEKGPKLASFILAIGKERVVRLLNKID